MVVGGRFIRHVHFNSMALSSGGWAQMPPPTPALSFPGVMQSTCTTVLMSVRVSVCHSGLQPLCLPGPGDDTLRLQLSMDPSKAGEFRLALREVYSSGRSVFLAVFDLRTVIYEIKSTRCHELRLTTPPYDRLSFNFRSEQEAQEWGTVFMSSLSEAQRVANITQDPVEEKHQNYSSSHQQSLNELACKEELCVELAKAIHAGDAMSAMQHATAMAQQKLSVNVQPSPQSINTEDEDINLAVVVEDASFSHCFTVKVMPNMTVSSLKQQIFLEYGFHPSVQRWVMGQCLCADTRSLASYGVVHSGATAFLYLLSAQQARLSRQLFQKDQETAVLHPSSSNTTSSTSSSNKTKNNKTAMPDLSPKTNPHPKPNPNPNTNSNPSPSLPTPGVADHDWRGYSTLPCRLNHSSTSNGAEKPSIADVGNLEALQVGGPSKVNNPQVGWACPSCTFLNDARRPSCDMCCSDKPELHQQGRVPQERGVILAAWTNGMADSRI